MPASQRLQFASPYAAAEPGGTIQPPGAIAAVQMAAAMAARDEPLPNDSEFRQLTGCVLLPHVGSATARTRQAMFELALKNLIAGLQGAELPAGQVGRFT